MGVLCQLLIMGRVKKLWILIERRTVFLFRLRWNANKKIGFSLSRERMQLCRPRAWRPMASVRKLCLKRCHW